MQITRILKQLTEFSSFTSDLFTSIEHFILVLMNHTVTMNARISRLEKRIDVMISEIPDYEIGIVSTELRALNRKRVNWKSRHLISSSLFTLSSQTADLKSLYELCSPIPPLELLDPFRNDGLSSARLFSYPEFFVEEWKAHLKSQDGKKRVKQKLILIKDMQQNQATVFEVAVKVETLTKKDTLKKDTIKKEKGAKEEVEEAPVVAKVLTLAPPPPPRTIIDLFSFAPSCNCGSSRNSRYLSF